MKQKKKAGLTMVELLCALAVLLLVAACMVVGVSLAVRSYDRSLASSEAQVLCATLQTTVSDELRYSGTLFYDQAGHLTGFSARSTAARTPRTASRPMRTARSCWAVPSCCPRKRIPTACGLRWRWTTTGPPACSPSPWR